MLPGEGDRVVAVEGRSETEGEGGFDESECGGGVGDEDGEHEERVGPEAPPALEFLQAPSSGTHDVFAEAEDGGAWGPAQSNRSDVERTGYTERGRCGG